MPLHLLHLDDALLLQPEFLGLCRKKNAHELHLEELGSHVRLWGMPRDLQDVYDQLQPFLKKDDNQPVITFMGSGDFHHISALLLGTVIEGEKNKVTLIHFDNHPDWVHAEPETHCGSWINRALSLPGIEKVITIGVCSDDLSWPEFKGANLLAMRSGDIELFPFSHRPSYVVKQYQFGIGYRQEGQKLYWNNLIDLPVGEAYELLLSRIKTKAIYITIDKDVLSPDDAVTNWDQGKMRLSFLLGLLRPLCERYQVLGIDVNGDYSAPHYGGNLKTMLKKKIEIWLDQPRAQPDNVRTNDCNSRSNTALLKLFTEYFG